MPKKESKQNKKQKFEQERECYYEITLDNEQIAARQEILNNDITVLLGCAGTGKTAVACYTGLKMLLDGKVEKIVICRPTISNEDLGFLPGGLEDKYNFWCLPIIQNFNKMLNPKTIEYYLNKKIIEMLPLQYTRGVTYDNACMILDESQNTTPQQLKMVMSRIGKESKIIITGDCDQIDLRKSSDSGLLKIKDFVLPNFKVIELQNEHRKQIVIDILKAFKEIGY